VIFRQLFDRDSCTYTYLLAGRRGGEALIIDPVLERLDRYLVLLAELELRLVKAIDTHVHADHVSALAALRDRTRCATVMSEASAVDRVSVRVADGERIAIEGIELEVLHTPGHTPDSCCLRMADRVFTGDTLLIRGTGRTDFQHGDAAAQHRSLFDRLLRLPDETLVYPGHDYKGDTVSTIGEERACNPRLQVASVEEYVALMDALDLPNPRLMDVAVPANLRLGMAPEAIEGEGWALGCEELRALRAAGPLILVDLRDPPERERHGVIPGSVHLPYASLPAQLGEGGLLRALGAAGAAPVVFYCAHGERSAMAVASAREAGLGGCRHLREGLEGWRRAGGEVVAAEGAGCA